jgi:hypothetical protein
MFSVPAKKQRNQIKEAAYSGQSTELFFSQASNKPPVPCQTTQGYRLRNRIDRIKEKISPGRMSSTLKS